MVKKFQQELIDAAEEWVLATHSQFPSQAQNTTDAKAKFIELVNRAVDIYDEIQALEDKATKYDELTRILGTTNGQTLLKAANWDLLERLPIGVGLKRRDNGWVIERKDEFYPTAEAAIKYFESRGESR